MEFYYMKSGAETSKPNLMKSCTYEGRDEESNTLLNMLF